MSPVFLKKHLRRIISEALQPTSGKTVTDDVDFLSDEEFMLRWSDGDLSGYEQSRFLDYLHRHPDRLLDLSEMVSSGLITPPPLKPKFRLKSA